MTKTLKIVDGDVVLKRSSGRLETVVDKPKASQAIMRMLRLRQPWGAGLEEIVGTVPDDEFSLSAAVQQNIRQAFDRLVRAQRGRQLSDRTTAERLSSIQRMFVAPAQIGNTVSKTGYVLRLDVLTMDGELLKSGSILAPAQGG